MSRCRCDPISVAGCQCSASDSDCIGVTGSGTPGNPFVWEPNLDADPLNLLSCSPSGLMADLPSLYREPPRAKIRRTQDTTIPDGDVQFIEFNLEIYDTAGLWNPAAPFQLTAPTDGLYEIKFTGWWDDQVTSGSRRIEIIKWPIGSTIVTAAGPHNVTGSSVRQVGSIEEEFEAGEYISMAVRATTAGAEVTFESTNSTPIMSMRWVAPLAS